MKNINPNFDHRFVHLFHDNRDISDTINLMTDRALGVLNVIATQFEDDDANTLDNAIIYCAIDSVIQEIQDIRAYLQATKNPR